MFGAFDQMQRLGNFGNTGKHWHQDTNLAITGSAQNGAQLRIEHLRFGQTQPNSAQSKCRISSYPLGAIKILVGPQIKCPYRYRQTAHFPRHGTISFELFVLVGQGITIEKQEFTAKEADPGGPVLFHLFDVLRQFDIGMQFYYRTIQSRGSSRFDTLQLLLFQLKLTLPQPVFGQHMLVRINDYHALVAVHNQNIVVSDQPTCVMQRYYRRNVEAARNNGRVRS